MCPEPDIAKLAVPDSGLFHFSRFCHQADQAFCKKRVAHMKCDLRVWDIPTCKRLAKVRQTDPACQVLKKTKANLLMFRTVNMAFQHILNLENVRDFVYNSNC